MNSINRWYWHLAVALLFTAMFYSNNLWVYHFVGLAMALFGIMALAEGAKESLAGDTLLSVSMVPGAMWLWFGIAALRVE